MLTFLKVRNEKFAYLLLYYLHAQYQYNKSNRVRKYIKLRLWPMSHHCVPLPCMFIAQYYDNENILIEQYQICLSVIEV